MSCPHSNIYLGFGVFWGKDFAQTPPPSFADGHKMFKLHLPQFFGQSLIGLFFYNSILTISPEKNIYKLCYDK